MPNWLPFLCQLVIIDHTLLGTLDARDFRPEKKLDNKLETDSKLAREPKSMKRM